VERDRHVVYFFGISLPEVFQESSNCSEMRMVRRNWK